MKNDRIDKFLADRLNITRSEATKIIKKRLVTMNNEVVVSPKEEVKGEVCYLGKIVDREKYTYYILNKPAGYICSTESNNYKSVLELINGRKDLKILGRLDVDTTGLLIITNDGDLIHKITSPKARIYKKYYVEVDKEFKEEYIDSFSKGIDIEIDGEIYHTLEGKLEIIDNNKGYISICEGKYHQVKKMCAALGLEVTKLSRVQIGNLSLDDKLSEGEFKKVTREELEKIFK